MRRLVSHRSVVSSAVLVAASLVAATAWAESARVVSVEEHWELRVTQPDTDRSAPQTTMVMSPVGDVAGVHFLFTLNHMTVPDYTPGGVQVQLWDGGDFVQAETSHEDDVLDHADEVITWVQRLRIQDGHLTFEIRDGESETWGHFGGDDLAVSTSTTLNALNSYRPGVSLTESQVGYAENRVESLTLKKLVWVTEDGEVHEQNAPIPIDTSLDN